MAYGNISFTMATPFTSRLALAWLQPVLALARSTRDFAPLERISSLHFASFGRIESLRDEHGRKHKLERPYLLFFSLFDGSAEAYLADFSVLLPDYIDALWGKCVRYPGARGYERFTHWLAKHSLMDEVPSAGGAARYEYHGYRIDAESAGPDQLAGAPRDRRLAPMPLVVRALELHRRLAELKRQYASGNVSEDQVQSLAVESL